MRRAARIACIDQFVDTLPKGYYSPVMEGGHNFSGGQVQRIALARAIAADTPLLILDEASSALDYETEAKVIDNLQTLGRQKTVIIVTHRLSLARLCDRIVVMQVGEIVEQGQHLDLIQKDDRSLRAQLREIEAELQSVQSQLILYSAVNRFEFEDFKQLNLVEIHRKIPEYESVQPLQRAWIIQRLSTIKDQLDNMERES